MMPKQFQIGPINSTPSVDPYHRGTDKLTRTALRLDYVNRTVQVVQDMDSGSYPASDWDGYTATCVIDDAAEFGFDPNGRAIIPPAPNVPPDGIGFDPEVLRTYLEGAEAQALLGQLFGGWSRRWSSASARFVGHLDVDGRRALALLLRGLNALPRQYDAVWTSGWLDTWTPSAAERERLVAADDEELRRMAGECVAAAALDRVLVLEDLVPVLADMRERLVAADDERQ